MVTTVTVDVPYFVLSSSEVAITMIVGEVSSESITSKPSDEIVVPDDSVSATDLKTAVDASPCVVTLAVNCCEAPRATEGEYDYNGSNLHLAWQWNHNPDNRYWSLTERRGWLRLKAMLNSAVEDRHLLNARNTLTQRVFGPYSSAVVLLDVSRMKDGDEAGLTLFAAKYGSIGVKMEGNNKFLVTTLSNDWRRGHATNAGAESARIPLTKNVIYLKAEGDFSVADNNATSPGNFFYSYDGANWEKLGDTLNMNYSIANHFMGYRFGLYNFAKKSEGGYVDFDFFRISDKIDN